MKYINQQSDNIVILNINLENDPLESYIQQLTSALKQDKTEKKLNKKLLQHYKMALSSFKGVYKATNKTVYKQYRRISWPMRLDSVRNKLQYLTWS